MPAMPYAEVARSLLELAYVQGHIPGQEIYAIDTFRKFLHSKDRYPADVQDQVSWTKQRRHQWS